MCVGVLSVCQTLIVEGYFEGNYRGGFLAVPKGGKYVGVADVRRADIGGRLHGTLSARTLLEVTLCFLFFLFFIFSDPPGNPGKKAQAPYTFVCVIHMGWDGMRLNGAASMAMWF